ncbi:MAG TPA: DUF4363 family protein [Syntrophomonadaceae bacterium]|nr:DUF4363 family protein [Syntrophomonadaceae bacterium]
MRLLAPITVILIFIIASGIWVNSSLESSTITITKHIAQVNKEIRNDNWEKAVTEIEELEKKWEKEIKWWPILLDHQEIDNIEFSLAKVKEYIINESKPLALGQLSELKAKVEHIPEKEKFILKNVL